MITGWGTGRRGLASTTSSTSNNKPVAFTTRVPFRPGRHDFKHHDFPLREGHFRVTTQQLPHTRLKNQGLTEGADRDRLFALAQRYSPNYAIYADKTAGFRKMPVFRLAPKTP
ncbi:hypothetical protein GCM10023161_16910 [Mycobacterium paraffinicum]|uniref:Uncharacterized protein n=1 Tax=Mycobacterium paraffinicum TaxID=53378 RepID=A0ABP8RH18_9MYCO